MKRALIGIALTLCLACEREPTQIDLYDPRLIVHSLLRAQEDSVRVFVSRVDTRGKSILESPLVPVMNARVRIVHGADTTVLSTRSHCVTGLSEFQNSYDLDQGCYAGAIRGGVRSSEKYALFVDADAEHARGEAIVPSLPVLHSPTPGVTLQYSRTQPGLATSVFVRWSGTAPERRIELSLRTLRRECDAVIGTSLLGGRTRIVLTGDTATIAAFDVQCPDNTQSVFPAELLLTAYDAGYTRYLELPTTVRPEDAAVGLTEGLGLFAAAASVAIPVTLVRR